MPDKLPEGIVKYNLKLSGGGHDASLSIGFLELSLTFFKCKGAPLRAIYWTKIKFNITGNTSSWSK